MDTEPATPTGPPPGVQPLAGLGGLVTLLFSDVVGSTALKQALGDQRLVTVSQDNTAKLWELEPQHEVRSFGRAQSAYVSVAVSPNGQRIAAGTDDGLIKIWNPATGQEVATLKGVNDWVDPNLSFRSDAVVSLAFLPPDGNTLISSTHNEVRLWRAPSWAEIEATEAKERKEAGTQ